jgi:hypothetical protein
MPSANPFDFVSNYQVDAWPRSILVLDVVQRIANARRESTPDEERRLRRMESPFGGISLVTQTQESARA